MTRFSSGVNHVVYAQEATNVDPAADWGLNKLNIRTLLLFIVTRNSSFPCNNITISRDYMPRYCVNGPKLDGLPFTLRVETTALKTDCWLRTTTSPSYATLFSNASAAPFFPFFPSVDSFQFLPSVSSPLVRALLTQCRFTSSCWAHLSLVPGVY